MATDEEKLSGKSGKSKPISQEQIVSIFNQLRQEQRELASKASELEMEYAEHSLVIETLNDISPDRKCFRMIGGVLVERTVKEILPALKHNKEQIAKVIEALNQQITAKGVELNEFREKHNIRVRGEQDARPLHQIPKISNLHKEFWCLKNLRLLGLTQFSIV